MIRRFACLIILLGLTTIYGFGQEFDCDVILHTEALTKAEALENLSDFAQQLKQYINNYHWTNQDFGNDKIKCNFEIYIQGSPSDNHYVAQVIIGSQRPIRKLNKSTAVLRLKDDKWEFDYVRFQPLNHDNFRFDPLISFIDYYAYLILGFDFDTFNSNDGTPYFQKAQDIVNNARGYGGSGKGWDISTQNLYSRGTLLDELINPKFRDVREAVFKYHVKGLDYLYKNPEKAKQNMLSSIESIGKFIQKVNPRSLLVRIFFDTKYKEIADTFLDYSDRNVYLTFGKIDVVHQQTYEEYRLK